MEKRYIDIIPLIVETDDIENLSLNVLDDLEIGDKVVKVEPNGDKFAYDVKHRNLEDGTLTLVYADANSIKQIVFQKIDGAWEISSSSQTDIDNVLTTTEE